MSSVVVVLVVMALILSPPEELLAVVVVVVAVQCSATSAAHCVSESTHKANASQSPKSACFLLSVLSSVFADCVHFVHCLDRPTDDDHDHSLVCR